ncbi:MAG: 50S ribosomal protein L13 [Chloroherpetonaceae bacterium]
MEISARITKSLRKEDVQRNWWIIDAEGKTLGRLATEAATLLRGKHKANFTPHVDNGDFVIVINAEKVQVEGKRAEKKEYFHHTGYPVGARVHSFKTLIDKKPAFVIEHAVWGMIPKNRLGRQIIKKLKVYRGTEHPHESQKPQLYTLKQYQEN